jgi:hypothetical protein
VLYTAERVSGSVISKLKNSVPPRRTLIWQSMLILKTLENRCEKTSAAVLLSVWKQMRFESSERLNISIP